jgi:hypothetical protein
VVLETRQICDGKSIRIQVGIGYGCVAAVTPVQRIPEENSETHLNSAQVKLSSYGATVDLSASALHARGGIS